MSGFSARHHGQQPEPATTQHDHNRGDGRAREQRLHQPGQHPAGQRGRHDSGHRRGAWPRIGGASDGGNRNRPGEDKPGEDQPDNAARMPVAGRRQQAAPALHGRRGWSVAGFGRLGHDFPGSYSQHDTQPAGWRGRCRHARQNNAIGVQSGRRVAGGMITIPSPGRCPTRSATAPSRWLGSASGPCPLGRRGRRTPSRSSNTAGHTRAHEGRPPPPRKHPRWRHPVAAWTPAPGGVVMGPGGRTAAAGVVASRCAISRWLLEETLEGGWTGGGNHGSGLRLTGA